MNYIEQTRDWTEQERLEWVRTYKNIIDTPINSWFPEFTIESGRGKYDIVTKMIDSKKKCCDNCTFFAESEMEFADGYCMKNVANTLCGQYLENTYTFYCSYHKFRV